MEHVRSSSFGYQRSSLLRIKTCSRYENKMAINSENKVIHLAKSGVDDVIHGREH